MIECRLNGGICETDFGYNARLEGCANLSLEMTELGVIGWVLLKI